MGDAPITRPSLLLRIRDRTNYEAWRQFVSLYGPLVYQFAKKRGLQDADSADLTQIVFQAVSNQIERLDYDPRRGTFRGWLFTVTRHQLHKLMDRRQLPMSVTSGSSGNLLQEIPAGDGEHGLWEQEYQRRMFHWACDEVRGEFEEATWQAFWRTAVDGLSATDAGAELGMSIGAVYTAKSRVLSRLRSLIQEVEDSDQLPIEE